MFFKVSLYYTRLPHREDNYEWPPKLSRVLQKAKLVLDPGTLSPGPSLHTIASPHDILINYTIIKKLNTVQ